jgi:hypothetical protein
MNPIVNPGDSVLEGKVVVDDVSKVNNRAAHVYTVSFPDLPTSANGRRQSA